MRNKKQHKKGFTLIELMVSVSVFAVVVTMLLGSILSVFNANQKSKTLRSVMDNLNLTLESMTREIRFGTTYHCGASFPTNVPQDCGSPGDSNLTIKGVDTLPVAYSLSAGRIMRSINGGTAYALTSPDITITTLAFRVYGSATFGGGTNVLQPQVIIVVAGNVGTKASTNSAFSLETTVSQRIIDSQ